MVVKVCPQNGQEKGRAAEVPAEVKAKVEASQAEVDALNKFLLKNGVSFKNVFDFYCTVDKSNNASAALTLNIYGSTHVDSWQAKKKAAVADMVGKV